MTMTSAQFFSTLALARKFYAQMTEEWDEAVEEASAHGYRPEYCIHGTYQWTDYDNICGGCEEGVTLRRMAVEKANYHVDLFVKRCDWLREAPFPETMLSELREETARAFWGLYKD